MINIRTLTKVSSDEIYIKSEAEGQLVEENQEQFVLGPHRIFPGKLSISRSFGDAHIKLANYSDSYNILIAEPEIVELKLDSTHDFIVIGCDGIFDHMTNHEVVNAMLIATLNSQSNTKNVHQQAGLGVDMIIKSSMMKKSFDNVTAIAITFNGFEELVLNNIQEKQSPSKKRVSFNLNTVSPSHKSLGSLKRPEHKVIKSISSLHDLKNMEDSKKEKKIKDGMQFLAKLDKIKFKNLATNSTEDLNNKTSLGFNSMGFVTPNFKQIRTAKNKTKTFSGGFIKSAKDSIKGSNNEN